MSIPGIADMPVGAECPLDSGQAMDSSRSTPVPNAMTFSIKRNKVDAAVRRSMLEKVGRLIKYTR